LITFEISLLKGTRGTMTKLGLIKNNVKFFFE